MTNNSEFIGRSAELGLLDNLWQSPKATLLILYGRRRVGKTRLLTHWLKQHADHAIYWVAEPTSALHQLRSFSQSLYNFFDPDTPAPLDFSYANWEQALRQAALLSKEKRLALFIDEVPYLMDVNPDIMGTLQKVWDHSLSKANLMLALSGSQMGMMQREILSYEAPLYGRANAQMNLPPLPFGVTKQFFPHYSAADRAAIYAIWGGIPAYWERLNQSASLIENIRVQMLTSNLLMQEEPRILLQDFINDPHNYVGIMRAIASGANTPSEIATHTGLARGHVGKYVSVLQETGFVARQVSVTEVLAKSRRGRYFVTDPYLRFYYRFLADYQTKLALGEQQELLQHITQSLSDFIEKNTWQELCREWLLRASARGEIPVPVQQVGSVWTDEQEFDVVGIHKAERCLVLGSCHWQSKPTDLDAIHDLVMKTSAVVPKSGKWTVYYLGFASNGWTPEAITLAEKVALTGERSNWNTAGVKLVDLDTLDNDLAEWSSSPLNELEAVDLEETE